MDSKHRISKIVPIALIALVIASAIYYFSISKGETNTRIVIVKAKGYLSNIDDYSLITLKNTWEHINIVTIANCKPQHFYDISPMEVFTVRVNGRPRKLKIYYSDGERETLEIKYSNRAF